MKIPCQYLYLMVQGNKNLNSIVKIFLGHLILWNSKVILFLLTLLGLRILFKYELYSYCITEHKANKMLRKYMDVFYLHLLISNTITMEAGLAARNSFLKRMPKFIFTITIQDYVVLNWLIKDFLWSEPVYVTVLL